MSTINQAQQVQIGTRIFTGEQMARYKRIFNLFDINKDGVLDARELGAVAKVLGYQMQKKEVVAMLKRLDIDRNRQMSFEEFLHAVSGNLPKQSDVQRQFITEEEDIHDRPRFYSRPEPWCPAAPRHQHNPQRQRRPAPKMHGPTPDFVDLAAPCNARSSTPSGGYVNSSVLLPLRSLSADPAAAQTYLDFPASPTPSSQEYYSATSSPQPEPNSDMSYHGRPNPPPSAHEFMGQPPRDPPEQRVTTARQITLSAPQQQYQQPHPQHTHQPYASHQPAQVVYRHTPSAAPAPPQAALNKPFYADEIQKHREALAAFQRFDADGNGFITRDEAHRVLHVVLGFSEGQTQTFLGQCDVNADGKLSYTEFVDFYEKVKARKAAIDEAFHKFDRHNKGYVTVADAKRILGGLLFSESEIERLVLAHDTNRDGVLQYEEFMTFWTA